MANEIYKESLGSEKLFDEKLKENSISNALGKDNVSDVVKSNNTGKGLDILNENTQSGFNLSKEEESAREAGSLDYDAGLYHDDAESVNNFVKQERQKRIDDYYSAQRNKKVGDEEKKEVEVGETPGMSVTPGMPTLNDLIEAGIIEEDNGTDINPAALYKELLGKTTYEDLKYRCGLGKYDSYTEYYNRTKYIPKGYEMEARLLLAEEKRQKLYVNVLTGEMSESDFLYQAYGKDLMKQAGYDLESKLFWYNRISKGDYTNPLDNDIFLSQLIDSAMALFRDEKWFEAATTKKINESLAGVVTGTTLSDEKVYDLYKTQLKALSKYFHDDYKNVITAYQAGNLSSVFNPFLDVDGDGKYDYYYHLNGKLYAIEGSSGTGEAKAKITYNYDKDGNITGVHSAEIIEGADGALGGFFEGLGGFFGSLFELVSMADNLCGVQAFVHLVNGDYTEGKKTFWVDGMQDYKAFMSRTFSNNDMQIFDNTHEWGYEVARGVGTVTGQVIVQVILALLTYGAGNAAYAGGQAAAAGAAKAVGSAVAKGVAGAVIGAAVGTGVGAAVEGVQSSNQGREFNTDNMFSMTLTGAVAGFGIGFSSGLTTGLNQASGQIAKMAEEGLVVAEKTSTLTNVMSKTAGGLARFVQFVTKGNSGAMFTASNMFGRIGNAAILAVKDFAQVSYSLATANRVLKYLEDNSPDSGIKSLSTGEIIGRASIAAGVDLLISSTLRLQDKYGATSMARRAKNDLTAAAHKGILETAQGSVVYKTLTESQKAALSLMTQSLPQSVWEAGIDSALDVVENLVTMATSAAVSNPYAKLGSPESMETFWKSMVTPQAIIQNLYVTYRNIASTPGNQSVWRQRQMNLVFSSIPAVREKAINGLSYLMRNTNNPDLANSARILLQEFNTRCGYKMDENGVVNQQPDVMFGEKGINNDNYYKNTIDALKWLSEVFDVDTINSMDSNLKKGLFTSMKITEDDWKRILNSQSMLNTKGLNVDWKTISKTASTDKAQQEDIQKTLSNVFMAMVFDTARQENAEFLMNEAESAMNMYKDIYEDRNALLSKVFLRGVHDTLSDKNNKKAHESALKGYLKIINESTDSAIKDGAAKYAVLEKLYQSVETKLLPVKIKDSANLVQEKYMNIKLADALELFRGWTIRVTKNADGSYKFNWISKDGSGKQLYGAAAKSGGRAYILDLLQNKNFVDTMVQSGIMKVNETDGQIDLSVLNKPFVVVSFKKELLNEMRQDPKAQALLDAYDDLANLCTQVNNNGERVINTDEPIMVSVDVSEQNSDGNNTTQKIYVIPTVDFGKDIGYTDLARIEAANNLVTTLYSLRQSALDKADADKLFMTLGYYNIYGTADGVNRDVANPALGFDLDALTESEQETLRLKGISTILQITDFKDLEEKKPGWSRKLFVNLFVKGFVTSEDIDRVITEHDSYEDKNISVVSESAYEHAQNAKAYLDTIDDMQNALDVFNEINNATGDISIGAVKMSKLRNLFSKLHDPKNEWLKDALIQDGQITNKLLLDMLNNKELSLPFLEGLEVAAQSLALSKTSRNESGDDELLNELTNYLNRLAQQYKENYSFDNQLSFADVFRKSLLNEIDANYSDWKAYIDATNDIVADFKNYKEFVDSVDEIVEDQFGLNITSKGKLYHIVLSDETVKEIKDVLNKNTDVLTAFKELSSLWDNEKYNDARLNIIAEEIAKLESSEQATKFKEDAKKLLGDKFEDNKNSLAIWNRVSMLYNETDSNGVNRRIESFHRKHKSFHDNVSRYYNERTNIYSLRSTLRDIASKIKGNEGYEAIKFGSSLKHYADAVNTSYRELLNLSDSDLQKFFDDPLTFLSAKQKEIDEDKSLSSVNKEAFKSVLGELANRYDSKSSIMLFTLKAIDGDAPQSIEDFVKVLTDKEDSITKTYVSTIIKLALGDYSPKDLDVSKFKIKDNELTYSGKNVYDLVLKSNASSILSYRHDDSRIQLDEDYKLFHRFRTENTITLDNPKVIEVNVIDLIPHNQSKLIKLLSDSVDLAANKINEAKLKSNRKEINKLLSNTGYGGIFDTQIKTYLEIVNNCLDNNSLTLTVDLNNADAVSNFKKVLGLLGYDNSSVNNFMYGETYIPGALLKNSSRTAIETEIDYNKLLTLLNGKALDSFSRQHEGTFAELQKSDILENAFRSSHMITEDSVINIFDNGKPIKLYGIHNIFEEGSISSDIISQRTFEMFFKKGLTAGQSAKIAKELNSGFMNTQKDPVSEQTYKVLYVLDAVQEYLDPKNAFKQNDFSIKVASKKQADAVIESAKAFESKQSKHGVLYRFAELTKAEDGSYHVHFKLDDEFKVEELNIKDSFDIRNIVPIYTNKQYFDKSSNQTLVDKIFGLEIDGFKNQDDLVSLASKPLTVYSLDETEYVSFATKLANKNGQIKVGNLLKKDLSDKQVNNYWIRTLLNYVASAKQFYDYASEHSTLESFNADGKQIDRFVLHDPVYRGIIATLVEEDKYKSIWNGNATDDLYLEFAKEVIDSYKNKPDFRTSQYETARTGIGSFSKDITSGSASKLNIDNDYKVEAEVLANTVKELINIQNFKKSFFITNKSLDSITMPEENIFTKLVPLFIPDTKGNAAFDLDALDSMTSKDLSQLVNCIDEIAKDTELIKQYFLIEEPDKVAERLQTLKTIVEGKIDLLKQLGSYKDKDTKEVSLRYNPTTASGPSVEITKRILSDDFDDATRDLMIKMSENRVLVKKSPKRFISASSMYDLENSQYAPLNKVYEDLIDANQMHIVDKQGHVMIYNFDSAESRGAFMDSMISFTKMLKENNTLGLDEFGLSERQKNNLLFKLSSLLNVHSTGTTTAAEYSGALLVELNKNFDVSKLDADELDFEGFLKVTPIVESASDPDKALASNLLLGEKSLDKIASETNVKHILFNVAKNTFANNIAGYDDGVTAYDLDDENNRTAFYRHIINLAKAEAIMNGEDISGKTMTDLLLDTYKLYPSYKQRIEQLVDVAKSVGIASSVAELLPMKIQRLNVSNETSWSEQHINTYITSFVRSLDLPLNNQQKQIIEDVFVRGISYDALSDNGKNVLDNYIRTFELSTSDEAEAVAKSIYNNPGKPEEWKSELLALSDEDKVKALKLSMLYSRKGEDLEYIMNSQKPEHYRELIKQQIQATSHNSISYSYNEETQDYDVTQWISIFDDDTTIVNATTKGKFMVGDTEWGIKKTNDGKMYQIAFLLCDALKEDGENKTSRDVSFTKHNILIREGFVDGMSRKNDDTILEMKKSYYVEDDYSFEKKKAMLSSKSAKVVDAGDFKYETFETNARNDINQPNDTSIYIVNSEEDAVKLLNLLTSDVKTFIASNNKASFSDDARIKQYAAGQEFFNRVDNIDIRNDMLHSMIFDEDRINHLTGDSMDLIRTLTDSDGNPIIPPQETFTDKNGREAHDALSDVVDELNLYLYLRNHIMDSSKLYDSKYESLKALGLDDELIYKVLDFTDFDKQRSFTDSKDKELLRSFSSNTKTKSNTILKTLVDTYQLSEDIRKNRAENKITRRTIREALNPNSSTIMDGYLTSVKDSVYRKDIQSLYYGLMKYALPDMENILNRISVSSTRDADLKQIAGSYLKAESLIMRAATLFRNSDDPIIKDYFNKQINLLNNKSVDTYLRTEDAVPLFLSSGKETIQKYLRQAISEKRFENLRAFDNYNGEDGDFFAQKAGDFFSRNYVSDRINVNGNEEVVNKTLIEYLNSNDLLNYDIQNPDSVPYISAKNTLNKQIIEPLVKIFDKAGLSKLAPEFADTIINNLIRVEGEIDQGERDRRIQHIRNVLVFPSKFNEQVSEMIKKMNSGEDGLFYTTKALYYMTSEKGEFSKSVISNDKPIEFGTVIMGSKLLKRAFNMNVNEGDEFFTTVWREPGEGRTMHVVKIKVGKGNEYSMSRATNVSFFDGDSDGDYTNICKPDEVTQKYGESMWKYYTTGSSLLNAFESIKLKSEPTTKTDSLVNKFIDEHIDDYVNVFKAFENPKADTQETIQTLKDEFIEYLDNNGIDIDDIEDEWEYAGIQAISLKVNGQNKLYLNTVNNRLYQLLASNPEYQNYINIIKEGNLKKSFTNQLVTDLDSQVIGQINKKLNNEHADDDNVSEIYEILFAPEVSLPKDSKKQLTTIIKQINSVDKVKELLVNKLTESKDFLSTIKVNNTESLFDVVKDSIESSESISSSDIVYLAQFIQKSISMSAQYKKDLTEQITTNLNSYNNKYRERLSLLEDFFNKQSDTFKSETKFQKSTDVSALSGPQTLLRMSELLNKYHDYMAQFNPPRSASYNNSVYTRLWQSMLSDGTLNIKGTRDSMIISNDQNVMFHPATNETEPNRVNLSKARFMVVNDGASQSDSIQMTTANQKENITLISFDTRSWKQDVVNSLISKDKVSYDDLKDVIRSDKLQNYGGTIELNFNDNNKVLTIIFKDKLSNMLRDGYLKTGFTTAKAAKATLVSDLYDASKLTGKIKPDYIINKSLFDKADGSAFFDAKIVGQVKDKEGNTFDIYELDDMALLAADMDIKTSVKDRSRETISITTGLQGVDAFMNIGSTALEISKDGKIVFNPEGYNAMRDSLAAYDLPENSDVNAMPEINSIKIASMLSALSEEDRKTILFSLGFNTTNLDSILQDLYKEKTIGGNYGESLIEVIQNEIYKLSDSAKKKVLETINSNDLYKSVWSSTLDELAHQYNRSGQKITEDMFFKSKKSSSTSDLRRTRSELYNSQQNRLIAYSNGAIDYNDDIYYSRNNLLSDLDIKISKGKWNDIFESGNLKRESLYPTSQPGGFRPALTYRSELLDRSQYPELPLYFKNASMGPIFTTRKNQLADNLYNVAYGSRGKADFKTIDYLTDYRNNLNKDGEYQWDYRGMHQAHKYSMPYFYSGSDADTLYAMSNRQLKGEGNYVRSPLTIRNDSLTLGTDVKAINRQALPEYLKAKQEAMKNPLGAQRYAEFIRSQEFNLKSQANNLDALTGINDFLNSKATSWEQDILNIIRLHDGDEEQFINKPAWAGDMDIFRNLVDQEMIDNAIRLTSYDNGIELTDSIFNSWGYKAKNNLDIALGNRTLNISNIASQYADKYLGNEFKTIVYAVNKDKALGNIINKYVDMKVKIDAYETLITNSKEHIKNVGQKTYNEYLDAAKKAIIGKDSNVSFDEAYKAINTELGKIEKDEVCSSLIACVNKLNQRILVESKKHNPYSLIGYYMPLYEDDKTKELNVFKHYVDAYNFKNEKTLDVLNGYKKNPDGTTSFASSLYNSKLGYLGMITKVAQQYAVNQTLKDFSSFLKSNGYMSNAKLFTDAHLAITKEFEQRFIGSFEGIESEKRFEYDKITYQILRDEYNSHVTNGSPIFKDYTDASDFVELYYKIKQLNTDAMKDMSRLDLEEKVRLNEDTPERYEYQSALEINNTYENILSTMICILEENNKAEAGSLLESIYNSVDIPAGYMLVDSRGAVLTDENGRYPSASTLDMDDIIQQTKMSFNPNRKAEIAKMMLTGDVYLMRESVAQQLDKKVFTKQVPGVVGKAIGLAKDYVTSFIMANPMQLVDRTINFTIFDIGALMQADATALNYLPLSIATIQRYKNSIDSITMSTLATDRGLQMLFRYMAATGQSPIKVTNLQGEKVTQINIPVVKQFMALAQNTLASQQFFARFAYFWDLSENLGKDGWLDPKRFGVAFHKQDGLREIQAGNKGSDVYNSIFDYNQSKLLSFDNEADAKILQDMMNRDAAAVQVVAENVGIFGNMPYGSGVLSKLGFMFTGFPMAAMRWGINRFQSLAYAVQNIGKGQGSSKYLLNNFGSTLAMFTMQLAFQLIASPDTRKYIKKRLIERKSKEETEEELGETAVKNAETILWRGGSVKLFDSWLKKEEQTNASHSRSPLMYLWNNFVADYVLKDEDQSAGDVLWNQVKTHLWGHAPVVLKDVVESIPGNTFLQSSSWYTPSDNFIENMGRKAIGYIMGSQQANSFIDAYKAEGNDPDSNFLNRIGVGMRHAYIDDSTGIKEYKSSWRNYKKAFSILYDYIHMTSNYTDSYDSTGSDNGYKDFKSELNLALKEKTSAAAFYNIIKKYKEKGMDVKTMKSALENCSLRSKLEKLNLSQSEYSSTFSDSELAVIKSALAYEDYMFPYLSQAIDEIQDSYWEANKYKKAYNNIGSALKNYYYNYPTLYNKGYNSNYKNYNRLMNFYKNSSQKQYKSAKLNPMETYNAMRQAQAYGTSKDVWGNETRHYTDGTTYSVRQPGMPFPGSNK